MAVGWTCPCHAIRGCLLDVAFYPSLPASLMMGEDPGAASVEEAWPLQHVP